MLALMIPLMITGGFDGVEPYEPVKYEVVATPAGAAALPTGGFSA